MHVGGEATHLAGRGVVVDDDVDGVHMHKGHLVRLLQGHEVVCTSLRAGLKVGAEMAGAAAGAPLQFGSHPTSRRLLVGTWVNNPGFEFASHTSDQCRASR